MPTDNNQSPSTNTQTVVPVTDDLPPMPPLSGADTPLSGVTTQDNQQPITDSGSAAPSNDIVMPPVVTGTTPPKKKFAGGKIIATILGLFLLVGGVGAGIVLVNQNQNIKEQAAIIECFPAGTKITTADGGVKNIEDFKDGDLVLSENTTNNSKTVSKTTKLWNLYSFDMCSVGFEDGDSLKLTSPHPLFTKEGWKAINEVSGRKHNPELTINKLNEGDYIKKQDGSWNKVTDISCKYGLFKVYNLAVDTTNNYFAEEYLVHNKKSDVIPIPGVTTIVDTETGDVIDQYDTDTGEDYSGPSDQYVYNLQSDEFNCGVVNNRCGSDQGCSSGVCGAYCSDFDARMGYCGPPPMGGDGCMLAGDTTGVGECNPDQLCHIQGGQTGTYGVCVSKSSFITACTDDGREWSENSAHPSSVTCCEEGYHANPNGAGCIQGSVTTTTGGNPPEDTPPPSTSTPITAVCQNVKAYSSTWALLTNAQLAQLAPNTTVNFCVTGSATGGSFNKAKFTINGVVQPETTTVRPGSTDFCQSYVIPAGVTSFNVSAQINHVTLGWK